MAVCQPGAFEARHDPSPCLWPLDIPLLVCSLRLLTTCDSLWGLKGDAPKDMPSS